MSIRIETTISDITQQEVKSALDAAVDKVRRNLPAYTYACQNHSSENGFYPAVSNTQWTSGFWPGTIWLSFEHSHDKCFQYAGQILVQSFLHRIENRIETDHHDMGFLYSPSCVSAWNLVQDEDAKRAAILAADQLIDRFQPVGNFIQAWGDMSAPENYRYIIDALMNLPLLYWASRITGDEKYVTVARKHAQTTYENSIRDDFSTHHSFYMDRESGLPVRGSTVQGYKDDSAWTRGQSWGIYGMALLYRFENDTRYLDMFDRLLAFYLERLPTDLVPYWDLSLQDGDEPRDSSSAVIVACGLLEMAGLTDGDRAAGYQSLARKFMKSIVDNYAVQTDDIANGHVLHGTYSKKSPFNTCTEEGVDECLSWGDYYYMEALSRLHRDWNPYW